MGDGCSTHSAIWSDHNTKQLPEVQTVEYPPGMNSYGARLENLAHCEQVNCCSGVVSQVRKYSISSSSIRVMREAGKEVNKQPGRHTYKYTGKFVCCFTS